MKINYRKNGVLATLRMLSDRRKEESRLQNLRESKYLEKVISSSAGLVADRNFQLGLIHKQQVQYEKELKKMRGGHKTRCAMLVKPRILPMTDDDYRQSLRCLDAGDETFNWDLYRKVYTKEITTRPKKRQSFKAKTGSRSERNLRTKTKRKTKTKTMFSGADDDDEDDDEDDDDVDDDDNEDDDDNFEEDFRPTHTREGARSQSTSDVRTSQAAKPNLRNVAKSEMSIQDLDIQGARSKVARRLTVGAVPKQLAKKSSAKLKRSSVVDKRTSDPLQMKGKAPKPPTGPKPTNPETRTAGRTKSPITAVQEENDMSSNWNDHDGDKTETDNELPTNAKSEGQVEPSKEGQGQRRLSKKPESKIRRGLKEEKKETPEKEKYRADGQLRAVYAMQSNSISLSQAQDARYLRSMSKEEMERELTWGDLFSKAKNSKTAKPIKE